MKIKVFYLLLAAAVSTGCSNHSGSSVNIGYSGFDSAKTVSINPHGNICRFATVCTGIGAQWNASNPEYAILLVRVYDQYAGISKAELNIDGRKINLTPTVGVTDLNHYRIGNQIFKESTKGFIIPVAEIKKILESKKVWLRLSTPTGYLENAVIDDENDSKAYHALSRFMDAVRG